MFQVGSVTTGLTIDERKQVNKNFSTLASVLWLETKLHDMGPYTKVVFQISSGRDL